VTARDHHHRARAELGDAHRPAGFAGGVLLHVTADRRSLHSGAWSVP
jgi:hypothetical protein